MQSPFVHLRVHSAYSLSSGAVRMHDIPELCQKYGMPALALTDSGNLFGSLEFAESAMKQGVQPIMGCVMQLAADEEHKNVTGSLVLLAQHEEGYKNLLKLVTKSFLDGEPTYKPFITYNMLEELSNGLICLTGGAEGLVGKALQIKNVAEAENHLLALRKLFPDRLYIELMRHGMEAESATEEGFIELAYKHDIPLVATNDVYFPTKDMYEAHDALICIAEGRYISEPDRPRFTPEHYFKSGEEMEALFSDLPEAIQNTSVIARRCAFAPESHAPMLPKASEGDESEAFIAVAKEGLQERLETRVFPDIMKEQGKSALAKEEQDEIAKPYWERLDYETGIICKMEFPGYFLIVSDFIRWSKDNGIPVGPGRGSGAGSVVAWAMKITDLDPLRFGLLFERFLNPERISMPDFDVDFCQERRDEVIRYVQDTYGKERVAQIITFGKLQARAVLRDVGRVLQMPYGQVDRICKMIPFNPLSPVTLSQAIDMDPDLRKEQQTDEQVAKLLDIGLKLEGLYRHASTHAAGVVIGSEALVETLPLYTDHRSSIPTTQYSMKYAEKIGLVKFDFLGLKTLTTIDRACDLVRQREPEFDIDAIPLDDRPTYDMLSQGSTVGVFQMESAGMRDALRKMKPDSIEDIIALISLYRPGPMDNIPTYIARKHGKETPDYLHPKLEECLKETYGVIIYQEQVMQIAQILSGYTLGGADLLRRAMGKKIKEEMDKQRELFVEGAVKNGVDRKQASSIFDLVAKFAGYGFNKSHAAAYAVIGYHTAYLKANYPVEFLAASMNIDIGDTDKLNIFREEAVKNGIMILPPDINRSGAYFTVETLEEGIEKPDTVTHKRGIRYALGALKNVGLVAMQELEQQRATKGGFTDIADFASHCTQKIANKRQIENLAKAGAFDGIHPNRRQICEGAAVITRHSQTVAEEKASQQNNLFGGGDGNVTVTLPLPDIAEWDEDDKLTQEYEAVGFYLTGHPLGEYASELGKAGVVRSAELEQKIPLSSGERGDGVKRVVAGVVTRVVHRATGTGKRFAYVYLSDATGTLEISLFNDALINESRELLEAGTPLVIQVDARRDDGGVRLQADHISTLESYFQNRTGCLDFAVEQPDAAEELKKFLDQQPEGKSRIRLFIKTNNKMRVTVLLPQSYSITPKISRHLSELPGITLLSGTD